jgi:RNA polymerase sigma factor (sigma-70 family)
VTAHVVELIPLHLERVATRCYALLGDWRLTEEAVQETMVNLLRTARRCPPRSDEEAVAGWINDMARRVCLDVLRRRAVATSADAADSGPRVERRGHDRGTQADRGVRHRGSASANRAVPDRSAQIVAKLDEPVRSILKMRLWDRRSFEEIGRALGKPASAVVSHYQLALVKLKKLMAAPPAPADSSSDSSEAGAPAAE